MNAQVHSDVFAYEGGLAAFVDYLNTNKNGLNKVFHFNTQTDSGIAVEVAMQWNDSYQENVFVLPIIFHNVMVVRI
jgi:DNA gyrase subunit B